MTLNVSTAVVVKRYVVSGKRCEIEPRLLLITNRKSHTPFQMKSKSSTLDDL